MLASRGGLDHMTTTSRDVLAARRLADDLLFPDAMRVDGLDVLPVAHLDALAAEGLYGASVPCWSRGSASPVRSLSTRRRACVPIGAHQRVACPRPGQPVLPAARSRTVRQRAGRLPGAAR